MCGYIYDEKKTGVRLKSIPDDWECPVCGEPKSEFIDINSKRFNSENDMSNDKSKKEKKPSEIDNNKEKLSNAKSKLKKLFR